MRRHYRHTFTVFYPFHKINSSRHNNIMAFKNRYYNANSWQRRYRIRRWIPMFFGTPCIIKLLILISRSREFQKCFCSINCYIFNTLGFRENIMRDAKFSRIHFSRNFASFSHFRFIHFCLKMRNFAKKFSKYDRSLETLI